VGRDVMNECIGRSLGEDNMTHDLSRTDLLGPAVLVRTLRLAAALSVLAFIGQGATAGELLMRHAAALEYHQVGAIVLHVFTALTAIAAFLLWRRSHAPLWPPVLAVIVFVATLCQAALGHVGILYLHVPLALLLMLGSAWLLSWSVLPVRYDHS
jgi:hypothetical protein